MQCRKGGGGKKKEKRRAHIALFQPLFCGEFPLTKGGGGKGEKKRGVSTLFAPLSDPPRRGGLGRRGKEKQEKAHHPPSALKRGGSAHGGEGEREKILTYELLCHLKFMGGTRKKRKEVSLFGRNWRAGPEKRKRKKKRGGRGSPPIWRKGEGYAISSCGREKGKKGKEFCSSLPFRGGGQL